MVNEKRKPVRKNKRSFKKIRMKRKEGVGKRIICIKIKTKLLPWKRIAHTKSLIVIDVCGAQRVLLVESFTFK